MSISIELKKGSKYQFKGSCEKLVYLGYNFSSNGHWYQFALQEKPDEVWAEMQTSDLLMIEDIS